MRTLLTALALSLTLSGALSASVVMPTIRQMARHADVILFGTVVDSRVVSERHGIRQGTSDFAILTVLRDHPALNDKKRLILPEYIDFTSKGASRYLLVFCHVRKGEVDPGRDIAIYDLRSLDYIKKAIALDPKDTVGNLAFHLHHLMHPDPMVAHDAHHETSRAGEANLVKAAPRLDPGMLRAWLRTPGLKYWPRDWVAVLLGLQRKPRDAEFIRALLDAKEPQGQAGLLAAYMLLAPKAGLAYVTERLKGKEEYRFSPNAALWALGFLHEHQPGVLEEKAMVETVCLTLDRPQYGQPVELLRRWKRWDTAPKVVALTKVEGYAKDRLLRRAVIRYCLQCKGSPEADDYLSDERAWNLKMVKEIEAGLPFED